jgi:hypothetical protein
MTVAQPEKHYADLSAKEARRFNLLVFVGLKLGKPIEGAYDYAKTIMDSEK